MWYTLAYNADNVIQVSTDGLVLIAWSGTPVGTMPFIADGI